MTNEKIICFDIYIGNDSLITAENVGVTFSINGVKSIGDCKGFRYDPELKDEQLKFSDIDKGSILVKGISTQFLIEIEALYPSVYFSFSYYCTDSKAESKIFIINKNAEVTHSFNSKNDPVAGEEMIFNQFKEIKLNDLAAMFSPSPGFIIQKIDSFQQVAKAAAAVKMKFPEGYVDFLLYSNGFEGKIGKFNIKFLTIEEVAANSPLNYTNGDCYVTIGELGTAEIVIGYVDKEFSIGILKDILKYTKMADTFFVFIEKLHAGVI